MEDNKLLLRVVDVMERTSLGRTKVYELIGSGAIHTVRVGRAIRIPARSLREWVEKQEQEQYQQK